MLIPCNTSYLLINLPTGETGNPLQMASMTGTRYDHNALAEAESDQRPAWQSTRPYRGYLAIYTVNPLCQGSMRT